MSELRRCPFCGGEASLGEGHSGGSTSDRKYVFVNCVECLMSNDMIANMQVFDKEMAIEHWNTRSDAVVALPSASPNPSSFQFPKLVDVTTEVYGRLNKKHLPWNGSAIVAVRETYSIVAGNKKR